MKGALFTSETLQILKLIVDSPITSPLLGLNILVSTLISNTLSLRYSLYAKDQVSHHTKNRQNCGFYGNGVSFNVTAF